jgi:hypothetical protein
MSIVTLHLINSDTGPQTLKSRAGDVFTLGAYIYPKTGNTGGGTIKLQLNCTSDVSGGPAADLVVAVSETVPATGSWTYISGTATVPAGYDTVDPQLILTGVPVGDVIYTDDVLVRETTAAQNFADSIFQALTGTGTTNNTPAALGSQFSTWVGNLFSGGAIGTVLKAAAIPSLDASKITTGVFAQAMVNITSIAGSIVTGVLGAAQIPSLDASKITTGSFVTSLIPNITKGMSTDLQSVITNIFGGTTIGTVLQTAAIPNITKAMSTDLQSVITNIFGGTTIGTVLQGSAIPNITKAMSTDLQSVITNIFGSSSIGTVLQTTAIPNITKAMSTDLQSFITNVFGSSTIGTQIATAALPSAIPSTNIPLLLGMNGAANMVADPDFEATTLWVGAAGVQTTAEAHSGTHSWSLTGAG